MISANSQPDGEGGRFQPFAEFVAFVSLADLEVLERVMPRVFALAKISSKMQGADAEILEHIEECEQLVRGLTAVNKVQVQRFLEAKASRNVKEGFAV